MYLNLNIGYYINKWKGPIGVRAAKAAINYGIEVDLKTGKIF